MNIYKFEDYAIFVGRLTQEKGIMTLIEAWKKLEDKELALLVVGEGELLKTLEEKSFGYPIKFLGKKTHEETLGLIRRSQFLVFPSEWYEGSPMVLIEALALGVPIIASDIGGIPEIVKDGFNGLLFKPGNVDDLKLKIERMMLS